MHREEQNSWPEKYRPRRFDQVVGQAAALTRIKALVKRPRHLVISGPSGTGKTTFAGLYAQALMCQADRASASACGQCEACKSVEDGYNANLYRRSPAELGAATVKELMVMTGGFPMYAGRHVILINEAQKLTDGAIDEFLDPMEKESAPRTVIFTLINADDLPEPLRTRCQEIRLEGSSLAERLEFLNRIVAGESLSLDQDALELLAHFGRGYRGLARDLQALAEAASGNPISVELVRQTILRDRADNMLTYLSAVASGNWARQEAAVGAMTLSPRDLVGALLDVLLHLKLRYIGPATSHDRRFELLLADADCRLLLRAFEERADAFGLTLAGLFDEVLEYWTFMPPRLDDQSLRAQLVRFHDLLNLQRSDEADSTDLQGLIAERAYRSTAAMRLKPKHRARLPGTLDPALYLDEAKARDLYEGASFLVQRYGVHFNSLIRLTFRADAAADTSRVPGLLFKDLRRQLERWSGSGDKPSFELHRVIVIESDHEGRLVSTMLFHAPPDLIGRIKQWIDPYLANRKAETPGLIDQMRDIEALTGLKANTRHWKLMRQLWRGVDPTIMVDGQPLVERLQIPPAHRRQAGKAPSGRRYNFSKSLSSEERGREARLGLPAISPWADGAWEWLFNGWEAREHKDRVREEQRRARILDQLEAERRAVGDALHRSQLGALIAREVESWPSPRLRERSTKLWW